MIRGIYHSAAGMLPRYYKLLNVSNNMANASTTSFKADRRHFLTVLNNELVQPGVNGQAKRVEELDAGVFTNHEQGAINSTGAKNHMALNGAGFFVVEDQDNQETFYTRDGRFKINHQGELVTNLGYRVLDDSGAPIQVGDEKDLFVDEAGDVFIRGQQVTSLMLADFANEDRPKLLKKGDGLYQADEGMVPESVPDETRVVQGALEMSNVNVVEEMVQMIALNRNYESSQRALTAQDQSLSQLINRVPKV